MATKGELASSPRYQEILAPLDLGDELRAALIVGSKCWGFMCLHRERSSPNFTSAEATLLARLAPTWLRAFALPSCSAILERRPRSRMGRA